MSSVPGAFNTVQVAPVVHDGVLSVVVDRKFQRLTLANAQVSPGPSFAGEFQRWFADGLRFVTIEGTARRVHVYDLDGREQHVQPDNAMYAGGFGDFLWTFERLWATSAPYNAAVLRVYRVGNAEPFASRRGGHRRVEGHERSRPRRLCDVARWKEPRPGVVPVRHATPHALRGRGARAAE